MFLISFLVEKSLNYKGTKQTYKIGGIGKPVILIHGAACNEMVWASLLEVIGQDYQIILPILPGIGNSELLHNPADISDYACIIRTIVEQEKIAFCCLLGHSFGGYIVVEYIRLFSEENIAGWGLLHSTPMIDSEERKNMRLDAIEILNREGDLAKRKILSINTKNHFAEQSREKLSLEIQKVIDIVVACPLDTYMQQTIAMLHRLNNIPVVIKANKPVIFLVGRYDPIVPVDELVGLANQNNNIQLAILENSGHWGLVEEPLLFNEIVKNFIKSIL
ncbi:MAG: alpha/beta hydrolase [Phycisphaerales bacterium]|nr:alpha/beta hydrolase [Phycisphaerales bacterium]